MDLEDFISTTLRSIRLGIHNANEGQSSSYIMNSNKNEINFDIAVEVTNEKKTDKSGGLKIKVIEGSLGTNNTQKESNVSRIKFSVGVNTHIK